MRTPVAPTLPGSTGRLLKGKAPAPPGKARSKTSSLNGTMRVVAILSLVALLAAAIIYPASYASPSPLRQASVAEQASAARPSSERKAGGVKAGRREVVAAEAARPVTAAPQMEAASPFFFFFAGETLTTYADDCVTPQSTFSLGDTVCARVSGMASPLFTLTGIEQRRFSWVNVGGYTLRRANISTDPATDRFTIPSERTSTFGNTIVDNRGRWALRTEHTADASVSNLVYFTVRDPQNKAVDLAVTNIPKIERVSAGASSIFTQYVVNNGPDAATSATLTTDVPEGTTFVSATQISGPAFNCTTPAVGATGQITCTAAAPLASDSPAAFTFVFEVDANAPNDTLIANTATITGATSQTETHAEDNTAEAAATVFTSPCTITPAQSTAGGITVNNEPGLGGAHVTYDAPTVTGTCGEIECSPASGSFFPLGETNVICTGLASGVQATFKVTVNDTQTPTMTCPNPVSVPESPSTPGFAVVNFPMPTVIDNDPNVQVTLSKEAGTLFPVGTTVVTATATDVSGNTASCTFNVTVFTPNCVLSCPQDIVVTESSPGAGAVVNYNAAGTSGNDCGTPTYDHASGSTFPVGTTIVTATDSATGAICSFKVTVLTDGDEEPPVITCPANIEQAAPANSCSLSLNVGTATATDNRPGVTVAGVRSDSAPLNAPYPVGETVITWTATDAGGNAVTCEQSVKVTENIPPSATAPAPRSATVNASCENVEMPNFVAGLTASDNCTPSSHLEITQSPAAETPVGVGTHPVTITVMDTSGNKTTVSTTFTVIDNTPPTITLNGAASVAVECHTSFNDPGATATDACDGNIPAVPSSTVDVNTPGTYTITYNASDASGNAGAPVTRTVTVVDTRPPVISCPGNITVELPANSPAISTPVSFNVSATDSCGTANVQTSVASGSLFSVGTTIVTATATDEAGNTSSCQFNVTVRYRFTGFFSPVGNVPVLNVVNAGRAIPVKFSLSGNKGLSIFAVGFPASGVIPCDASAPAVDLVGTVTAAGSSLAYDAGSDQYSYVWKTESAWAGTCRQLVVRLNDGTDHFANFRFK